MTAPDLEPCPFCGPMNGHYGFTVTRFGTRLTCFCCDSHGPRAPTQEEAIAAWNTRATPAALSPEVRALVEAAQEFDDALDTPGKDCGAPRLRMSKALAALRGIGGGK